MDINDSDDWDDDAVHFYCVIHIIFSTRQQMPFLVDEQIREQTFANLSAICDSLDSRCVIVSGSDDHVHLLVEISPDLSLDQVVTALKTRSGARLRERGGFFADFDWQESSIAFTLSGKDVPAIKDELTRQAEYHKQVDFKTEIAQILGEQEIEYTDELWE